MRNRPAFKLTGPFIIHNFYLTVISAVLLTLFLEQLIPTVYNHGIFYAICDVKGGWTPPLVTLYYVCARLATQEGRLLMFSSSTISLNTSS